MYSSKIVTVYCLVYLNEKVEKGLSLKKKVSVDYEKYNCYIDIFKDILKGLRHDDMAVLGQFSAIVIN